MSFQLRAGIMPDAVMSGVASVNGWSSRDQLTSTAAVRPPFDRHTEWNTVGRSFRTVSFTSCGYV